MRWHNIPILFKLIWLGSFQQVGLLRGLDSPGLRRNPRLRRNNERGILGGRYGA